jgi:hypothetical protein
VKREGGAEGREGLGVRRRRRRKDGKSHKRILSQFLEKCFLSAKKQYLILSSKIRIAVTQSGCQLLTVASFKNSVINDTIFVSCYKKKSKLVAKKKKKQGENSRAEKIKSQKAKIIIPRGIPKSFQEFTRQIMRGSKKKFYTKKHAHTFL